MPADMDLMVNLVPDKSELESATDQPLEQEVETTGQGGRGGQGGGGLMGGIFGAEAATDVAGGSEKGGIMGMMAGGGGSKGIMAMVGKIAVIAGGVMAIAQAVMQLEPMKAIMSMINKFIQLLLLPFVMMLFRLLKPILVGLIKVMPLWLKFWQDPVGNLMALAEWIGEKLGEFLVDLPSIIVEGIKNLIEGGKSEALGTAGKVSKGFLMSNPLFGAPQALIAGKMAEGMYEGATGKEIDINLFGLGTEAEAEKISETEKEKNEGWF